MNFVSNNACYNYKNKFFKIKIDKIIFKINYVIRKIKKISHIISLNQMSWNHCV